MDAVRVALLGGKRERFAQEAIADFIGTSHGLKEGARRATRALASEQAALREQTRAGEIVGRRGAIGGRLGEVIRLPFRAVALPDIFLRTANREGEIAALATRQALQKGLKGDELAKFVASKIKRTPSEILEVAEEAARVRVFQNRLTGFTAALESLRQRYPLTKLIVPFWRTPVNLWTAFLERTPAGVFKATKAYQAGDYGLMADYLSKALLGSSIMTAFTAYAIEGNITGRLPDEITERNQWTAEGKTPYSVRIGDNWYSYRGLEPLSDFLAFAADMAQFKKEPNINAASAMVFSLARNMSDQPFSQGISDLLEAFADPERKGEAMIANLVGGAVIPTGVGMVSYMTDPYIRKPEGIIERLKVRIPGLAQTVPPRLDFFGQPLERAGPGLGQILPSRISPTREDPLASEFKRLEIPMGFPTKTLSRGNQKFELNREEHNFLIETSGKEIKKVLDIYSKTPAYQQLTDEEKTKTINSVVTKARDFARDTIMARKIFSKLNEIPQEVRGQYVQALIEANILSVTVEEKLREVILEQGRQTPSQPTNGQRGFLNFSNPLAPKPAYAAEFLSPVPEGQLIKPPKKDIVSKLRQKWQNFWTPTTIFKAGTQAQAATPTPTPTPTPAPALSKVDVNKLGKNPESQKIKASKEKAIIYEAASEFEVDPDLMVDIGFAESSLDPRKKGPTEDVGLFQFTPATWRFVTRKMGIPENTSRMDAKANARAAAWAIANGYLNWWDASRWNWGKYHE